MGGSRGTKLLPSLQKESQPSSAKPCHIKRAPNNSFPLTTNTSARSGRRKGNDSKRLPGGWGGEDGVQRRRERRYKGSLHDNISCTKPAASLIEIQKQKMRKIAISYLFVQNVLYYLKWRGDLPIRYWEVTILICNHSLAKNVQANMYERTQNIHRYIRNYFYTKNKEFPRVNYNH